MLEVSSLVQNRPWLVLRILPKLTADTVYKTRSFPKFVWKKLLNSTQVIKASSIKWYLCWYYYWVTILRKKQGSKKNAVGPTSSGSYEVVFTLLTKIVAIQVEVSIIEVETPGLQRLLLKFCLDWSRKQSLILIRQMGLYEILE